MWATLNISNAFACFLKNVLYPRCMPCSDKCFIASNCGISFTQVAINISLYGFFILYRSSNSSAIYAGIHFSITLVALFSMFIAGPFYYITIAIANIKLIKIEASNPNDNILFAHKQGSATSFDILISLSNGIFFSYGLNIRFPLLLGREDKCTHPFVLSKSSAYKSHSSNNSGLVRK